MTTLTRVPPTADLFRTTHKVKTQQVVKSRGQHCGDIDLPGYLVNETDPVPVVLVMSAITSTSGRLHREFIRLLFLQAHRETDRFFAASGVQLAQTTCGLFHYRRTAFSSMLKSRVGNILAKAAPLRINLKLDGAPIASKSHTHPSHSQTSRLLTSSLSLSVSVPRPTQCMRGMNFFSFSL